MAKAKTLSGSKLLIKIGDGADPEAFTHNCSINGARSLQFEAQTNDVDVPDCDDPDLMAWKEREKVSLGATIQGAGVLNTVDIPFFNAYFKQAGGKNVRVVVDKPGVDGGGYWAGEFIMTGFQVGGERGQKSDFSCTLVSNGEVDWVDA